MKQQQPISIIGMACELAGPANSLANFYDVIINAVDATSRIASDRWKVDLDQVPPSILRGGFLQRNPWIFDHQFFSLSPKEAARIDPQYRMLLENTYHAFEDANINPSLLKGQKCGVFMGLGTQDYARLMHHSGDFAGLHSKGSLGSMAAGRISYHFDFIGPSLVVDTACSSSLVALHQAVQSLQRNECDIAVVGGATLILAIDYSTDLANAGMLSKDGRCKAFSHHADGFARGEGVGVIILQRQQDAVNNNRKIYANILGSAINCDGESNGITAPSKESQQRVIKDALLNANLSPHEVDYIEAHGTGTNLGDKIEFSAISHVHQGRQTPIYIGSVKANISHCEAAAGIAGVIKTSLCIYHNKIPPHVMADSINKDLRPESINAVFPQHSLDQEEIIAGISSFGMSGSNAHVILGSAESPVLNEDVKSPVQVKATIPFLFVSAKSADAFVELSESYSNLLNASDDVSLKQLLNQANTSRKHWLNYRSLFYGNTKEEFLERFGKINIETTPKVLPRKATKMTFLFTGQGAIYKNMTRPLYDGIELYKNLFDEYANEIDNFTQLPEKIKSFIFDDQSRFSDNPQLEQLSLFLIEFTLSEFFAALGVKPDFVVGHSLGEYAAACSAGILSFQNAIQMITTRSQETSYAQDITTGAMVQILTSKDITESILNEINSSESQPQLWLSGYNAPEIHVISGTVNAINLLIENLKQRKIIYFKLNTKHAFHTPLFASAALSFKKNLEEVSFNFVTLSSSTVKFISTVREYNKTSSKNEFQNLSYWESQIVEPVRFAQAIQTCYENGSHFFVEIGPDLVLASLAGQCLKSVETNQKLEFIPVNLKRKTTLDPLFGLLHSLYVRDLLDVSKLYLLNDEGLNGFNKTAALPLYPFSRTELIPDYLKYPATVSQSKTITSEDFSFEPTKLELKITLDLNRDNDKYIAQHVISETRILPGSYYVETANAIVDKLFSIQSIKIKNVSILSPVIFADNGKTTLKVTIAQKDHHHYNLIFSELSSSEKEVCHLSVYLESGVKSIAYPPTMGTTKHYTDFFYSEYAKCGVTYGPLFKMLKSYSIVGDKKVISEIQISAELNKSHSSTRTIFLDNCFQTIALCLNQLNHAYAPISVKEFKSYSREPLHSTMQCYADVILESPDHIEANLAIYNSRNEIVMEVIGISCYVVDLAKLEPKVLHDVVLQQITTVASEVAVHEAYALITHTQCEKTTLLETSLLTPTRAIRLSDLNSSKDVKANHLIYLANSLVETTDSLFDIFDQFYKALRLFDDNHPGQLKTISILDFDRQQEGASHLRSLQRAIVLVFPTEFPNIIFRFFSYDKITKDNAKYLLNDDVVHGSNRVSVPFWKVLGNSLFQYKIVPENLHEEQSQPLHLNTKGYYLITGGLGGIGRQLITYMADTFKIKNFVVTVQRAESLTEDKLKFIEALKNDYDVNIICKTIDLSTDSKIIDLFKELPRPLCGIFHLAGINIDLSLGKITQEKMKEVLAAKMNAAFKLHELSLQIEELEHFVLFSSMATLISSPGQFSYTLANLGLFELAELRAKKHLPVTLIDWGPWKETGMMNRVAANSKSSVAISDFEGLSPTISCKALFSALRKKDKHHFAVFKLNEHTKITTKDTGIKVLQQQDIKELLISLIIQETNYDPTHIKDDLLLSELGIDSINTIRIRAELQTQLNISIPLALLLDSPTVASITSQLKHLWLENNSNEVLAEDKTDLPIPLNQSNQTTFFPLSQNQFSIWYEQQAVEDNVAYHCSIGWVIKGDNLYLDKLKTCWESLLNSNEMLRAVLVNQEGEIGYKILSLIDALQHKTISIEHISSEVNINQYFQATLNRKIDFYNELPTVVYVIHHQNNIYLILSSHHIILDATSMFLVGEKLLRSFCDPDDVASLIPASSSYHEFVEWQKNITSDYSNKAIQFFVNELFNQDDELLAFELPKKSIQQPKNLALGGNILVRFSSDEMQSIMSLPANMRVHVCLSAWALLLAKYSGEKNILVGIAFNGRTQAKWSHTIGHFINVLPMRVCVDQHMSSLSFLNSVKDHLFQLLDFQEFPLTKLLKSEKIKGALQGRNLLQTYFNYFDASKLKIDINNPGIEINSLIHPQQEAQFEISLWITRELNEYIFNIKYRSDLLSESVVNNLADHYRQILLSLTKDHLAKNASSKLLDIKLVSAIEEEKIFHSISQQKPHQEYVYDHFIKNVSMAPHSIAIEMKDHKVDYQQLSHYVDQLSSEFNNSKDNQGEETVAILLPEKANIEFIISVLMLWKNGYAYLPLNTSHPLERITYMMEAAGCQKIINIDPNLSSSLRDYINTIDNSLIIDLKLANNSLIIDKIKEPYLFKSKKISEHSPLAYILFTSGSTGLPKGVLVEQNGLIDRILWMKEYFHFSSHDKFLQSTALTFDISVPEFCLPLISGGTCVLFDSNDNPNAHAEICERNHITMMSTVPSLFSVLQEGLSQCKSLRHIILVGEILPPASVNQWLDTHSPATLYNLYGPTEDTIYATYYPCRSPILSSSVPIGSPCANVIPLVLDSYGNFVPNEVIGELYLAGSGVARGYIGGQLKENPFANNPFQSQLGRIYKTGDYVRWIDNETLEYIGRKDTRIKLNGLLIELGEIEQLVLKNFPSVLNAAAVIVDFNTGNDTVKHIVLCLMPESHDIEIIANYLKLHLPKYMLPWKIISFAEFPRNSSNKVDRKALVNHVRQRFDQPLVTTLSKNKDSSNSVEEEKCLAIWKNILRKENIDLDDNFFELGGDSLLLTKMTLLIEKDLAIKINFAKFLSNPTINSLLNGITTNSISWEKEFQINDEIQPFVKSKVSGSILLTGATGHLGIHLLHELLLKTDKNIHLIIRAKSKVHATERLKRRYDDIFTLPLDLKRVHIHNGDLAYPAFDLEEGIFSTLCQEISVIIHAAAEVNHAVDYARLKASNVTSTNNIIKFANLANSAHIFYISTQFSEINSLSEDYFNEELIHQFSSGYEQSKFIAEIQMKMATQRGYPITTLRLPLIIDGADPSLLKQNHFVALISKCLRMGFYPQTSASFDILPTLEISRYVSEKCMQIPLRAGVYNCLMQSIKLSDIFGYLNTVSGFQLKQIDYPLWRDKLIKSTPIEDIFYPLLPLYTTDSSPLVGADIDRTISNNLYLKEMNTKLDESSHDELIEKIGQFLENIYRQYVYKETELVLKSTYLIK